VLAAEIQRVVNYVNFNDSTEKKTLNFASELDHTTFETVGRYINEKFSKIFKCCYESDANKNYKLKLNEKTMKEIDVSFISLKLK
jgi:hypothetical protein